MHNPAYEPPSTTSRLDPWSEARRLTTYGTIITATAYTGIYQVLVAGRPLVYCHQATGAGCPGGVRENTVLSAGTRVMLYIPDGQPLGVITGVLATNTTNPLTNPVSWAVMNSGVGFKDNHQQRYPYDISPVKYNLPNAQVKDLLGGEYSRMSVNGVGVHQSALAYLARATDLSELYMSSLDNYQRLTGWNRDVRTAVDDHQTREDQGELLDYQASSIFPWETRGTYRPGDRTISAPGAGNPDGVEAAWKPGSTSMRCEPVAEDQVAVPRQQRWGGYAGRGDLRVTSAPDPTAKGVETMSGGATHNGMILEHRGLDGQYVMRAARGILLEKTLQIPVPRQAAIPEDPTADTDANYQASGVFGDGPAHAYAQIGAPYPAASPAFNAFDRHAWEVVVNALQPLLRHVKDWRVANDAQNNIAQGVPMSGIQYVPSAGQRLAPLPTSTILQLSPAAGDSRRYFRSRAFIEIADDGSIIIEDAWGSQTVMSRGNIRYSPALDFEVMAGRDFRVMAGGDVVILGNKDVDISSSTGTVRVKAQKNIQAVAVDQGVLIESKSKIPTVSHTGTGKSDVFGGVTLKSAGAVVAAAATEVHVESGGKATIQAGDKVSLLGTEIEGKALTGAIQWLATTDIHLKGTTGVYQSAAVCAIQGAAVEVACGALTVATGTLLFTVASSFAPAGGGATILGDASGLYLGQNLTVMGTIIASGTIDAPLIQATTINTGTLNAVLGNIQSGPLIDAAYAGTATQPTIPPVVPPTPAGFAVNEPAIPAPVPSALQGQAATGGFSFRATGEYASPAPDAQSPIEAATWQSIRLASAATVPVALWNEPQVAGGRPWPGDAGWSAAAFVWQVDQFVTISGESRTLADYARYNPTPTFNRLSGGIPIST